MNNTFPNRRRNYYIKKEFQRNFIMKFCALVFVGSLVSGLLIYAMSAATVTTTFENSRLTIKSTADYILPTVLLSTIVVMSVVGAATVIITLLTSHKIAGALYAIEKRVDEVSAGNLKTEFHLRSGDQLKSLAVSLNVMVGSLRKGVRDLKDAANELDTAIGSLEAGKIPSDIKNKLDQLKAKADTFNV